MTSAFPSVEKSQRASSYASPLTFRKTFCPLIRESSPESVEPDSHVSIEISESSETEPVNSTTSRAASERTIPPPCFTETSPPSFPSVSKRISPPSSVIVAPALTSNVAPLSRTIVPPTVCESTSFAEISCPRMRKVALAEDTSKSEISPSMRMRLMPMTP